MGGLSRRRRYVVNPYEPRQIFHLIERAEAMLADGGPYLTDRHRVSLERALAEVKTIAPGRNVNQPVEHGDVTKIISLARLIGGLGPARESIKKRVANDSAAKARAIKSQKHMRDVLDTIIAEEYRPGMQPKDLLGPVNERWEALGKSPISKDALGKHVRKLRRLMEGLK
jgi:hypothetical protein